MPIPMQKIWNRLMNCPASEDADSCISPMLLSMMVSIRFTPTVMRDCREIGMAMRAISASSGPPCVFFHSHLSLLRNTARGSRPARRPPRASFLIASHRRDAVYLSLLRVEIRLYAPPDALHRRHLPDIFQRVQPQVRPAVRLGDL